MIYRRKPVTVEAVVWTGTNDAEVREFVGTFTVGTFTDEAFRLSPRFAGRTLMDTRAELWTRATRQREWVRVNDAIVKDPDGGCSVVSAAVFSRDYEAIEEGL